MVKGGKTGFTLIELLTALMIISILISMALPNYARFVRRAESAEAKSILRSLSDAVWYYYMETGGFPEDETGLDIPLPTNSKYFVYGYGKGYGAPAELMIITAKGVVKAIYRDAGRAEDTDIVSYYIGFRTALPQPHQMATKMDNTYYRYFWRKTKTEEGSTNPEVVNLFIRWD